MKINSIIGLASCLLLSTNVYANTSSSKADHANDTNLQVQIDIPTNLESQKQALKPAAVKAASTATVTAWTLNNSTMTEGDANALSFTLDQASTNTSVRFYYTGTFNGTTYNTPTLVQTLFPTNVQTNGSHNFSSTQDNIVEAPQTLTISTTTDWISNGTSSHTVTVVDDDTANVSLSASAATLNEAAGSVTLTATLDKQSYEPITVNLAFSGSSTNASDYSAASSSITIATGQLTGTTTVTATQDTQAEIDETIIVDISSVSGGNSLETGTQQQTLTIIDDDTTNVQLLASTTTLTEGSGTATTLTAQLDAATYEDVTVNLALSGTGTNAADYTLANSTLTISAGNTQATTTLTIIDDSSVEVSETAIIDISSVSGGKATESGTQQQSISLIDNDSPNVTLIASASTLTEGSGTAVTLTAQLDTATYEDVTVNLALSGTGTSASDYTLARSNLTISPGNTQATTTLTIIDDNSVEVSETAIIDISSVSGGKATESGTQQQSISLIDNDSPIVTLSASTSTLTEGSGAATTLTAQLDIATYEDVTVNLALSGTATSASDYTLANSTLTISAGNTQATTTLTIIDDSGVEVSETAIIDISSVSGGKATESGTQQQSISLIDDDSPNVTLMASASTLTEGSGTAVTLTAQLDAPTYEAVTVNLTLSGTGTEATDYTLASSALVISAGNTQATTTLSIIDDNSVEVIETAIVDISSVSGGKAIESGTQQQSISLIDNDNPNVTLSVVNQNVDEGASQFMLTANVDKPSYEAISVTINTTGSASNGADYTIASTTLIINAGDTQASLPVTVLEDDATEDNETIIFSIDTLSGGKATHSGSQQLTVSIIDNDINYLTLTTSDASMDEDGGSIIVSAQLTRASQQPTNITLKLYGLAQSISDYQVASNTITIAAGQASGQLQFTAIDDNDVESNEVIIVALESVTGENLSSTNVKELYFSITDNDSVEVNLDVQTATIDEAQGFGTILATLPHPVAANVSVNLSYSGTATAQNDFTNAVETIVIEPGETSKALMLLAKQDTSPEDAETIIVNIESTEGVNTTTGSVTTQTLTILDDDQVGPVNYGISIDLPLVNKANQSQFAFNLHATASNAANGTFYDYIITDSLSNKLQAQGEVTTAEQVLHNIDLSALEDGPLSVELRLVDSDQLVGSPATATIDKNTITPLYDIISPKNNGVISEALSQLVLEFEHLMQLGEGDKHKIEIKKQSDNEVVISFAITSELVEIGGSSVVIDLPNKLEQSGCYYITITDGAFSDILGNPFAGMTDSKYWRFTLNDSPSKTTVVEGETDQAVSCK